MNTLDIERGERLLTADEIAEILHISRAKVYRLIQDGHLSAVKIHRLVRVIPADLRDFAKRFHRGQVGT
jgi:excisionase family DNA binding protein